jgi:hypothetical protein
LTDANVSLAIGSYNENPVKYEEKTGDFCMSFFTSRFTAIFFIDVHDEKNRKKQHIAADENIGLF